MNYIQNIKGDLNFLFSRIEMHVQLILKTNLDLMNCGLYSAV